MEDITLAAASANVVTLTTSDPNTDPDTHVGLAVSQFHLKIAYYTIGSVGMVGNLLVLYVIGRSPNMRTKVTNFYIVNQSVADLMGAFFMVMTSLFEETARKLSGIGDEIYCRLWLTKWLLWAMFMVSTYSLILITIERYLAVVHAVWHKTSFTRAKALWSIVLTWLVSFVYIACYMIVPTVILDGRCSLFTSYVTEQARGGLGILTFVLLYLVPLVVLIVCYIHMAKVLHRRIQPSSNNKEGKKGQMGRAMNNVIKTLAAVSVCFILCWSSNQICFLMFNVGYPSDFGSVFYHFTVIALFVNCCVNPFIYCIKYESFRRNLFRLFPFLPKIHCCRRGHQVDPSANSVTHGHALTQQQSASQNPPVNGTDVAP